MKSAAPPVPSEQVELVLRIFRSSRVPLTLDQARKNDRAAKIKKTDFARIVQEQLLVGKLFECQPAKNSKSRRFWGQDEGQRVREEIEKLLAAGPGTEYEICQAVTRSLGEVTTVKAVKACLERLTREGALHLHPGKEKTSYALTPFDPLAAMTFQQTTLNDLRAVLKLVTQAGLSLDQFMHRLGQILSAPPAANGSRPKGQKATSAEPDTSKLEKELRQLIDKALREVGPDSPIHVAEFRASLPAEMRGKNLFDKVIWQLVEQDKVFLGRHNHPASLTQTEREQLLSDEQGGYYVYFAQRG